MAMVVTKSFIRAWYDWQHAETPYTNSRERRFNAPTYQVELALDHLASHIYITGLYAIEGKKLNYAATGSEGLSELDRVAAEMAESVISEIEEEEFEKYISVTRKLLKEMKSLVVPQGAV
jgi:hypothetical protein